MLEIGKKLTLIEIKNDEETFLSQYNILQIDRNTNEAFFQDDCIGKTISEPFQIKIENTYEALSKSERLMCDDCFTKFSYNKGKSDYVAISLSDGTTAFLLYHQDPFKNDLWQGRILLKDAMLKEANKKTHNLYTSAKDLFWTTYKN